MEHSDEQEEPFVDEDFMERHFADFFNLYSNAASTIIRFGWRETRDENARYTQEIRMPTPVAKLLAILLIKRLRDDELRAGYIFEMPQELLDAYGITDMEWRQAWLKEGAGGGNSS